MNNKMLVFACIGVPILTIGIGIVVAHFYRTMRWLRVKGTVVELHDRDACLPNARFIHWVVHTATLRYLCPGNPARNLEAKDSYWTQNFYTGLRQQVVMYVNPRRPEQVYVPHTLQRLLMAGLLLFIGAWFLLGWALVWYQLLRREIS